MKIYDGNFEYKLEINEIFFLTSDVWSRHQALMVG